MKRVSLLVCLFVGGCAAHHTLALDNPDEYASILISERLPDRVMLCVPLQPLRTAGQSVGCISVGELRASLRGRRTVALEVHR